jgi:ParB/RepB/Spo0J family partition protein
MATALNAGDVRRGEDMFKIEPQFIVVNEADRGRAFAPSEDKILRRAYSMFKEGQKTPCEGRKIDENRVRLNAGFTRHAASMLIREGFEYEGEWCHDPEFRLKVILSRGNEEEAFKSNVIENLERNETSPIDDAHNQERFRDRYGWADDEIARFYGVSTAQVQRLSKLLSLSRQQQQLVHEGKLTLTAALDILDMPEDKRDELIKAAVKDDGTVETKTVRNIVRDHHLRNEGNLPEPQDGEKAPKRVLKSRTLTDVKEFLHAETLVDAPQSTLAKALLAYIKGEITTEKMQEVWDGLPVSDAYVA